MATTHQPNRQTVRAAVLEVGIANNGSSNAVTMKVPYGTIVTNVKPVTKDAFDGTGTVTLTVADGTNTYVNAQDVKTTGVETVAVAAAHLTSGGTISAYITDQNSDSAAGKAYVVIEYVTEDGCDHIYG